MAPGALPAGDPAALEAAVGYRFRDSSLLTRALTHKSRANEDPSGGTLNNESLEFLGDAILGFAVADELYRAFPQYDEGRKSKIKAALVSAPTLARLARALDLGGYLILGRGEEKTGGRRKLALAANAFEALIAAIYLDGGIEPARAFIEREYRPLIDEIKQSEFLSPDYKSALQEYLQASNLPLPRYRVAGESGPDHRKVFQVELIIRDRGIAVGEGRSKKEAEQIAAKIALERLTAEPSLLE